MTGEPTGADPDGSVDVATGSVERNPLPPEEMSDEELYTAYQSAKEYGPMLRLDELQLEIAQRWEDQVERDL